MQLQIGGGMEDRGKIPGFNGTRRKLIVQWIGHDALLVIAGF